MRGWGSLVTRSTEGLWAHRSQESPNTPAPPLSMLRIKSENGEQAFLLMMWPKDTIGDVRTLLAQTRWGQGKAGGSREALAPWPGLTSSTDPQRRGCHHL